MMDSPVGSCLRPLPPPSTMLGHEGSGSDTPTTPAGIIAPATVSTKYLDSNQLEVTLACLLCTYKRKYQRGLILLVREKFYHHQLRKRKESAFVLLDIHNWLRSSETSPVGCCFRLWFVCLFAAVSKLAHFAVSASPNHHLGSVSFIDIPLSRWISVVSSRTTKSRQPVLTGTVESGDPGGRGATWLCHTRSPRLRISRSSLKRLKTLRPLRAPLWPLKLPLLWRFPLGAEHFRHWLRRNVPRADLTEHHLAFQTACHHHLMLVNRRATRQIL